MKARTSVRHCEVVTLLNHPDDGHEIITLEALDDVLSKRKCIDKYAYIIHDRDVYTDTDEQSNSAHKAGTLKPEHLHLIMHFKSNQPQKLECIGSWFGLASNFVSKIFGTWEDACAYLIHLNASDKYQYAPDNVISNFDYEDFLNSYRNKTKIDEVIRQILAGKILAYNYTSLVDQTLLVKYHTMIEHAFAVRNKHLMLTSPERNMDVIFISGTPGCGKTTLAKKIAREQNLAFYVTSNKKNPLDEYEQQPCIIADELRPDVMAASDLLKFLDNDTASAAGARYRNKYVNCNLIIVTSPMTMNSFFSNLLDNDREPLLQLQRRCQTYIQMTYEEISVSIWDQALHEYTHAFVYKNDVLDNLVADTPKTDADIEERVSKFMPFLQRIEKYDEDSGIMLSKINENPDSLKVSSYISDEEFKKIFTDCIYPPK